MAVTSRLCSNGRTSSLRSTKQARRAAQARMKGVKHINSKHGGKTVRGAGGKCVEVSSN